jgi:triosephosphate isomerase (TIM)
MRTPIIAGNWKMYKTPAAAVEFVKAIREEIDVIEGADAVVCPPATALPGVSAALEGSKIGVGAQNMHYEQEGAYTGELAPEMITPFCQYVILGHSERRAYFCETDENVNKKAKAALAHGLTPIICVGESLEQNEAGETLSFVSGQVRAALDGMDAADVARCIIAYEPIWAIGTGKAASAEQAGQIIKESVRDTIAGLYGAETAETVRIQYGGSTNPENIGAYMAHPEIDGALVGGASLKPSFVEMVRVAAAQ